MLWMLGRKLKLASAVIKEKQVEWQEEETKDKDCVLSGKDHVFLCV